VTCLILFATEGYLRLFIFFEKTGYLRFFIMSARVSNNYAFEGRPEATASIASRSYATGCSSINDTSHQPPAHGA